MSVVLNLRVASLTPQTPVATATLATPITPYSYAGAEDDAGEEEEKMAHFTDQRSTTLYRGRNQSVFNQFKKQETVNTRLRNSGIFQTHALHGDTSYRLPYSNKCLSKCAYHFKTCIVTNPRLYSFYLLYSSIWPRALALLDVYTDFLVTRDLYYSSLHVPQVEEQQILDTTNSVILFMLSCMFMVFPFIMVWTASLRFVHKYISKEQQKERGNWFKRAMFTPFLALYLFPPIGCVLMFFVEIVWVLSDIARGLFFFMTGKILIIDSNPQRIALKRFRKVIEFFGESVPQLLLQIYIWQSGSNYVDLTSLYVSIAMSFFSFCYNLSKLYKESRLHGMSMAEYALSLLQLSEMPIIKLVPRLPAIRNGKTETCNFASFRIDKESLGPIIIALSDKRCLLKRMRLSIDSISKLDAESLKVLSAFFKTKQIKINLSRSANPYMVLSLFQHLDTKNRGYITFEQFKVLLQNTTYLVDEEIQTVLFKTLAIRRLRGNRRDRVYFHDFHESISGYRERLKSEYDCTSIEYPVHFAVQYVVDLYKRVQVVRKRRDETELAMDNCEKNVMWDFDIYKYSLNADSVNTWYKILNEFMNLVYFAIGMKYHIHLDNHGINVFSTILKALNDLKFYFKNTDNVNKIVHAFLWKVTLTLLRESNAVEILDGHHDNDVFQECIESNEYTLLTYLLHYKLLSDDDDFEEGTDVFGWLLPRDVDDDDDDAGGGGFQHAFFADKNQLQTVQQTVFLIAVKENLNLAAEFLLYRVPIENLFTNFAELSAHANFKLFDKLILSRPTANAHIVRHFLDVQKINTKNPTLITSSQQNILSLCVTYRQYSRPQQIHKNLATSIEYIKQAAIRDQLNLDANFEPIITRYRHSILECMKLFVAFDARLCTQQHSTTHESPLTLCVEYDDVEALDTILSSIHSAKDLSSVLNHVYFNRVGNMNLFTICVDKSKYNIALFLIERFFDEMSFGHDNLLHPFTKILKEYLYLLLTPRDGDEKQKRVRRVQTSALQQLIHYFLDPAYMHKLLASLNRTDRYHTIPCVLHKLEPLYLKPEHRALLIKSERFEALLNETQNDDSEDYAKLARGGWNATETNHHKLLLLGTSMAGKTTLLKQLTRRLGEPHEFEHAFMSAAECERIQESVVTQMKYLLTSECRSVLPKSLLSSAKKVTAQTTKTKSQPLSAVAHHIQELWSNEAVKNVFHHRTHCGMADTAARFFDDLERIKASSYKPSVDDVLLAAMPSMRVRDHIFRIEEQSFECVDVGGVRQERRAWMQTFEGVHCVVFCASLNDYDLMLHEDESVNAMRESLELFSCVVNHRLLRYACIAVLFTKHDLFRAKIKDQAIKPHFAEYEGPEHDYRAALAFITNMYEQRIARANASDRYMCKHYVDLIHGDEIEQKWNEIKHGIVSYIVRKQKLH